MGDFISCNPLSIIPVFKFSRPSKGVPEWLVKSSTSYYSMASRVYGIARVLIQKIPVL